MKPETIPFDQPSTIPFGSSAPSAPTQPQQSLSSQIWDALAGGVKAFGSVTGANAIGEGLGTAAFNVGQLAKGKPLAPVDVPKMAGGILQAGSTVAGLGLAAPAGIAKAAAQYGGLGAASAGGASLEQGSNLGQVAKDTVAGGALGAGLGATFNLLGKGINYAAGKAGPSTLSFTSGVPKAAIEQASANPSVAKQGLKLNVNEVRQKAVGSLQTLHNDLNNEFQQGLKSLTATAVPDTTAIQQELIGQAQKFGEKLGVGIAPGAGGLGADFSKSAIVKAGEETAVNKTLQTISTWNDFSPQGIQDLSERVGALRNFESGAQTQSSAIVGQIYHAVGDVIKKNYPELARLKTNFSTNQKVLDEIGNVLSAGKDKPTQIQGAVSRLDNLFTQNKDEYINVIKQLGERSGVDYLSLLAGGEFQKVLPSFIRGLGGGSAVGVGASVLNPYLLLLAPLFSPRVVGSIARNASGAAQTASQLNRAGTTQAIRAIVPTKASVPAR